MRHVYFACVAIGSQGWFSGMGRGLLESLARGGFWGVVDNSLNLRFFDESGGFRGVVDRYSGPFELHDCQESRLFNIVNDLKLFI